VPVTVHIPVRLRVDADALTSRPDTFDELDAALTAALNRALANSRAVAVEPRGGYLGLEVHAPAFSWSGDGLDRLPASLRPRLETRLRALVIRQAERALFDDAYREGVPEPVPPDPAEPIDRRRYWEPASSYALPNYNQQGRHVHVPVRAANVRPPQTRVPDVPEWATVWGVDELMEFIPDVLDERNRTAPESGLLGFMFRSSVGPLWIQIFKFEGGKPKPFWNANVDLILPKWDQDQKAFVYVPTPIRPVGSFKLEVLGGAGHDSPEAKRILDKYLRENILPLLAKTAPVDLEPHQIEEKFAQVSHEVFDALVRTAKGKIYFAQLGLPFGDTVFLVSSTSMLFGTVEILPVAQWVPARRRSGTGTGTGAGAGAKKGVLDRSILQRIQGGESATQPPLLSDTTAGEGSIYPKSPESFLSLELSWEPFEGEPSVDELGEDGKLLREIMERIAQRLAIPDWKPYAGRFLMNAAIVIGGRASAVQSEAMGASIEIGDAARILAAVVSQGNLGRANFTPKPSKAMALYKYILGTASWVNILYNAVKRVFNEHAHDSQLANLVAGRQHWLHHVFTEYRPSLITSCAWIFVYACQAMMLQLLAASRRSIERRLELRNEYANFFYGAVITQLSAEAELLRLREALAEVISQTPKGQKIPWRRVVPGDKWATYPIPRSSPTLGMQRDFELWMQKVRQYQYQPPDAVRFNEGDLLYKNDTPAIVDRYGNAWTLADLDLSIQIRHSTAMALDPVLNHLLHEHPLTELHRYTPKQAREALFALLEKMREKNAETRADTLGSKTYAFEKGRIVEISDIKDPRYIPRNAVAGFDLQGIHLIVWSELAPELGMDRTLETAVGVLFARELGFRSLKSFSEFVGTTLLSVVCPPLAVAVMAAQALHAYSEAKKLEGFYESFIDPEQLVSWADVQAELFVARVTLAISLIPMGGTIVRGFLPRARTLLQRGLKSEFRAAARQQLRALYREMAEELKKDLMARFAKEAASDFIIGAAMEKIMTPLIENVRRNASLPAYKQK
jgi:hypothetical protein